MHRLYCTVRWLRIAVRQLSCLSRIGCFTHTLRTTHTLKVGWLKLFYTSQLKLTYTSYQSFYYLWRHIGSDSICEGLISVHDQPHMRKLFIRAMQTATLRDRICQQIWNTHLCRFDVDAGENLCHVVVLTRTMCHLASRDVVLARRLSTYTNDYCKNCSDFLLLLVCLLFVIICITTTINVISVVTMTGITVMAVSLLTASSVASCCPLLYSALPKSNRIYSSKHAHESVVGVKSEQRIMCRSSE